MVKVYIVAEDFGLIAGAFSSYEKAESFCSHKYVKDLRGWPGGWKDDEGYIYFISEYLVDVAV
jgi:hypothetical protein